MTIARHFYTAGSLALIAGALSACMSGGPSSGPITAAPQAGVEGNWIGTDGVGVSRFSGGVFTTTALDTGNKLADGSYKMVNANTVEITVVSLIRNTTTNVNCALVTRSQLNCTSSSGQQFVLTRRA